MCFIFIEKEKEKEFIYNAANSIIYCNYKYFIEYYIRNVENNSFLVVSLTVYGQAFI